MPWKKFSKICRSESALNCRSHHNICCEKPDRKPDWKIVTANYLSIYLCAELWRVEINNNIIRVVKYEYGEYYKLWIWVEGFHDIKISMNAYLELWVWFDSTHLSAYSLLISGTHASIVAYKKVDSSYCNATIEKKFQNLSSHILSSYTKCKCNK